MQTYPQSPSVPYSSPSSPVPRLSLADVVSQAAYLDKRQVDWSDGPKCIMGLILALQMALEFQWDSIDYNADPKDPQAVVVRLLALAMHQLSQYHLLLKKEAAHA